MVTNMALGAARKRKNDEFYTRYEDVEREVSRYIPQFFYRSVYCPCDDENSAFFQYFQDHFAEFRLQELWCTYYVPDDRGKFIHMYLHFGRMVVEKGLLHGDGDFRGGECQVILNQCDIVVTNPPFSLFSDFLQMLFDGDKRFLVIGDRNASTKDFLFRKLLAGKVSFGYGFDRGAAYFKVPPDLREYYPGVYKEETGLVRFRTCVWYTNLEVQDRDPLLLCDRYDPSVYPAYLDYDAINVDQLVHIPKDYFGVIGVPVTFLDHWCKSQFRLLDAGDFARDPGRRGPGIASPSVPGRKVYRRAFIQRV